MSDERADPGQAPRRRGPRSYRPDVRPMVIVLALLVLVIGGWIVLSPIILPPPVR